MNRSERTFTAAEVIEIANETSDSLGNLYRLDFIARIEHEAAQTDVVRHAPLEVTLAEGMPFVKCSCNVAFRPQSAAWLRDHWQGDEASGVAALQAVVERQRADRSGGGDR